MSVYISCVQQYSLITNNTTPCHFYRRIRRMWDGNIFSLFVSSHLGRGYSSPRFFTRSLVPGPFQGYSRTGYPPPPSQDWGPSPTWPGLGYPPARTGVPPPLARTRVPLDRTGVPPGQVILRVVCLVRFTAGGLSCLTTVILVGLDLQVMDRGPVTQWDSVHFTDLL